MLYRKKDFYEKRGMANNGLKKSIKAQSTFFDWRVSHHDHRAMSLEYGMNSPVSPVEKVPKTRPVSSLPNHLSPCFPNFCQRQTKFSSQCWNIFVDAKKKTKQKSFEEQIPPSSVRRNCQTFREKLNVQFEAKRMLNKRSANTPKTSEIHFENIIE